MLVLLTTALLGALGRRIAGGAFQQWTGEDIGDVPVRVFFGLCLGVCSVLGGVREWWQIPIIAVGTFMSCSIPIHWKDFGLDFGGIAMGRVPEKHSWLNDATGLLLHAVLGIGAVGLLVSVFGGGGIPLIAASFAVVPCYELGWRLTGVGGLSAVPARTGLRTGSELGEVFWGAVCGVAAGGVLWQ